MNEQRKATKKTRIIIDLPVSMLEDVQRFLEGYEASISRAEAIRILLARGLNKSKGAF